MRRGGGGNRQQNIHTEALHAIMRGRRRRGKTSTAALGAASRAWLPTGLARCRAQGSTNRRRGRKNIRRMFSIWRRACAGVVGVDLWPGWPNAPQPATSPNRKEANIANDAALPTPPPPLMAGAWGRTKASRRALQVCRWQWVAACLPSRWVAAVWGANALLV